MEALGRLFDIGTGWAPVDINTADGATGKRISMQVHDAITFVIFNGAAASGTDDEVYTVQQHTAYTGGTSSNLASATIATSTGITQYYLKSEATLDNDEAWTKVTQAESASFTLAGAAQAAVQRIVAVEIRASQLGDGYTHLSLNSACTTSAARLAACLYFPHELRYKRKPVNLFNLLRPNTANV